MTYNCLGNSQFEVIFTIFRDCENGNPNAYFDDPASIGIFDRFGNHIRTELFPFQGDDTLDLSLNNPCYNIPPNVCIHTTTYRKQITLPFINGGYHLSYQRCCRNNIISNIFNPGNTGATYDVEISQNALLNCNSSARFNDWPPFFICAGSPLNYDNSAFDPDGDSLSYYLCDPYEGASTVNPAPFTPSSPPYTPVTWIAPYSVNNMLGGTDPLVINPITGLLTGTPANNGTFVVGICVNEYKNGVLTGTTKRDFQFTVAACAQLVTAMFSANLPACNTSLTLFHVNNSVPSNLSYSWDFGDGSPPVSFYNAVHTYPDTGTYQVQLVAGVGTPCSDTISYPVNVQLDGAVVSVPDVLACEGDTVTLVANNVLSAYNNITSYFWSPSANIISGQGTSSVQVLVNNNQNLTVSVSNNNGCAASDQALVQIQEVEALFDSVDFICNTSLAVPFVNSSTSVNNGYFWDFDGTGTSSVVSPTHTFPDSGTYAVTLIAGLGALCQDTLVQNIRIPLDGASILWTGPQLACYGDTLSLTVSNVLQNYNNIPYYNWTPDAPLISGQGTDSVVIIADSTLEFTINVVNENGCTDTVVTSVDILRINAVFDSLNLICNTSLLQSFNNVSIDTSISFLWDFGGTGTSTLTNPSHSFPDTGFYLVSLVAGTGTNCPDTFLQDVYIPLDGAEIMASDSQIVCRGDTVDLFATNLLPLYNSITSYTWSPFSNIISGQGTDSVSVLANADIDFQVVGLNNEGCRDTAFAHVNVTFLSPGFSVLALPDSIFVGQMSQLYATNFIEYSYVWDPDTTLSDFDIHDPEARPRETTTYYVAVTNQYCTHNDSVIVYIKDPVCANPVVFVPSAFSPDGDGHNDVLMVNGNNVTEMTISVYSRWGQKVFESNDQSFGWDGTFNGSALPPDVYGYYMQCTCEEGGTLFLKGNITLLR